MSQGSKSQGYECPKCKNNYSTAYSMYRHMRKVHNCDINRCVTLYCPIENCNESYDRYNALDTHLTHVHYADIRKETFNFSDLSDFEAWLRDITLSSKTKYIKRSCNNSYRYYRCHRSGLPKTSTDKINTMKSSVKIGRHCPSRIIAKITDRSVQVEFVPTHIGHECEIAKIPLSQKKRLDIACRLATSSNPVAPATVAAVAVANDVQQQQPQQTPTQPQQLNSHDPHLQTPQQAATQQPPAPQQPQQQPVSSTQQMAHPIQQQTHMIQTQIAIPQQQQQQQLAISQQTQLSNNNSMGLMSSSPNRQELTSRFEQLMSTIRSEKHAYIVKAQLEVCFALIRD